jgi:hypothetical protein
MKTMNTKLQPPALLDNTKLHTRDEYKAWQDAMYEYYAAIRAEEQREARIAAAKEATANRLLSDHEYHALALQREAEKQARQAERAAAERAEQDAKESYLSSLPEVAEVSAHSPFIFLTEVCLWANRGYTLEDDGNVNFMMGFYTATLNKPAPAAKKAK